MHVAARGCRQNSAGGKSGMHADVAGVVALGQRRHSAANCDRGRNGTLRVIVMGDRRAEHRHDTVANMLVDRAAHSHDRAVGQRKKIIEQILDILRVTGIGQAVNPDRSANRTLTGLNSPSIGRPADVAVSSAMPH